MKRGKNLFLSLLVLALLASSIRLWQQQREIDALKVQAAATQLGIARSSVDREKLETHLREEREAREALRGELGVAREEKRQAEIKAAAKKKTAAPGDAAQTSAETLKQWLVDSEDPGVLRRLNLQARNRTLQRYDELFKQLHLTPEQTEQFTKLLTDKRQSAMDVAVASFQRGEDPIQEPDRYRDLLIATRQDIENQIGTLLGDTSYAQYQDYDRSAGQSNVLNNLQLALRSTTEPLTSDQSDRLAEAMQASNTNRITAKVIADSKEFLSPVQLQALQDLRAVQQANSQKRNLPGQALPTAITPPEASPKP